MTAGWLAAAVGRPPGPSGSDTGFADGYAQTVTLALLPARTDGQQLSGSLADVADRLGHHHSLMGAALRLLTQVAARYSKVTPALLVRVVGAVRWDFEVTVRRARRPGSRVPSRP